MHAFRRGRAGYTARLDATERAIIARVVADVAELLDVDVTVPAAEPSGTGMPGMAGMPDLAAPPPDAVAETDDGAARHLLDPALARLLPPASEDEDVAEQMRELTEAAIRTAKGERLRSVWWDLQRGDTKVVVPHERAMAWAGALTDVRLVLAQRLGIEDAEDANRLESIAATSRDEVTRALATLYLALSWLQESLLEAMLRDLPDTGAL